MMRKVLSLLLALSPVSLYGADGVPYTNVKVCNPTETFCTDVTPGGSLDVNVTNSFAAGTPDRTAFTYGTTIQNAIGGVYQDTSPSVTAGQGGAVRITQFRALHLNLRDASGNESGINANPIRIDPTGTTPQPASQSGSWTTGRTWTLSSGTDSLASVQSGTWTVQQGGTPTSVANAWPVKLTDGTSTTAVKAASTAAVASDPSAVVALSPNSPLPTGSNTIGSISNVSGTISLPTGASTSSLQTTGNTSLSSIDTKVPTQGQKTMVNSLPVVIASDQTAVPASQSGTWTVQQGATPTAVGNAWPFKLTDGTNTTAVKAASTAPLATDPAAVVVVSPNGNQATAANQASIIGTKAPGTAATNSELIGCVYNSAGVALTNGQQAACQATATGAIKVDTSFSRVAPSYQGDKMRYNDMNVANGGVARATGISSTTVYTVLYNYTGSGQLFAFLIGFEGNLIGADNFIVKLEIDGVINFEIDTNDIGTGNLYNLNTVQDEMAMGFSLTSNVLRFASPKSGGLYYGSSVKISIKKGTSATSKQFRAGSVYLTKET